MNTRIKELAKEARLLTGWPVGEVEYQKFAELIIQECIAQIALMGISNYENEDIASAISTSIEMLKEHFGVEE